MSTRHDGKRHRRGVFSSGYAKKGPALDCAGTDKPHIQCLSRHARRGTLAIEATGNHHGVRLSLSDTGSGIPPEGLDKILEPLFTARTSGMGLGPAVPRNLIENNGPTIAVTSEIGRGSVFTITLPGKEEEGASADVSGGSPDDQIPYRLPRHESGTGGEDRFGR